ncbi:MAG: methionyl-tRNA formyltransferase [Mangrovibacterium sp.]
MSGKDLRSGFMGTPEFAVASLQQLVKGGYRVVGVITAPDKPAGRGRKLHEPAVKQFARRAGLPVLQPEKLRNPDFLAQLDALKADLQVVVAFRMLPGQVWQMPRLGTFNLHASLLPQYRGAAPLNWAVINGEKETGVTTFLLDHEIDTGKILFREKILIGEDDTVGDVHDRLMELGAGLVVRTVEALAAGNYIALDQETLCSEPLKPAPKIYKGDCRIDWSASGGQIRNLIRGLAPWPGAWTELSGEDGQRMTLKIYGARLEPASGLIPGTIRTDGKEKLGIAASDGWLNFTDMQLSGKKRMSPAAFLRGFHGIGKYRAVIS